MCFHAKEIGRNALAATAGILAVAAITAPCFIIAAFLLVGDEKPPKSQTNTASYLMDLGMLAGSFVGGFITASVSTQKNYAPVILTGILIIAMIGFFDISNLSSLKNSDLLYGLAIILLTLMGGFLKLRKKKQPVINFTFEKKEANTDKINF
jgi:hypothetical protein